MRRLLLGLSFAFAVAGVACDGDTTPPSFFDSGADSTTTDATIDAPDSAVDAGTTHAKLIAVHASPDLGAVRVCFAIGFQNDGSDGKVAPIAPIPKTAVAAGTGGALADLGVDLSQQALTPYVFLAAKIGASTQTCDALVTALTVNTDYFILPTIKNGSLAPNTTVMLVLSGCMRGALDPSADTTTCGSTYDVTKGNLDIEVFTLDRVIANTQRFGSQVVHAALPAAGVWSNLYGAQTVSAAIHPFVDGGADEIISSNVGLGQLAPSSAASLAMPTIDQSAFVVSAVNPDGGAPPVSMSIPLPLVYEATTGQTTGENAYFGVGANYSFVFLGDPRAPTTLDGGIFNGYSLHALAFPNDPPLPLP